MKKLIFGLATLLFAGAAQATADAHTRVYLVVQDIQSEEFFVERAPIIGCYGIAYGPQLAQFTAEYKVSSSIGCGSMDSYQDNINYLTCAKVIDSKENATYDGFSEITLDISKCAEKNNPKLITMIRTAAKLNFPLKKGEVNLKLIK